MPKFGMDFEKNSHSKQSGYDLGIYRPADSAAQLCNLGHGTNVASTDLHPVSVWFS
jgi:hypothetical protein